MTMMQVEEKPDITYADVGGCKEQIEKLREVVEMPLLHVIFAKLIKSITDFHFSPNALSTLGLNRPKECCFTVLRVLAKP